MYQTVIKPRIYITDSQCSVMLLHNIVETVKRTFAPAHRTIGKALATAHGYPGEIPVGRFKIACALHHKQHLIMPEKITNGFIMVRYTLSAPGHYYRFTGYIVMKIIFTTFRVAHNAIAYPLVIFADNIPVAIGRIVIIVRVNVLNIALRKLFI